MYDYHTMIRVKVNRGELLLDIQKSGIYTQISHNFWVPDNPGKNSIYIFRHMCIALTPFVIGATF